MTGQESLIRLIEKYGLHTDKNIQNLLHIYNSTYSEEEKRLAEKNLRKRILNRLEYPFQEITPDTQPLQNHVQIGYTYKYKSLYRIPENRLTKHLLTIGKTGAGKTNLNKNIIQDLETNYWIFDFKRDYRTLTQATNKQPENTVVFPIKKFRFNPLKPPPNVSAQNWLQILSETIADSQQILQGSTNYLKKHVNQLYEKHNVYDLKNPDYPTLITLLDHVEDNPVNYARRQSNYRDVTINRLNGILIDAGTTFQHPHGIPVETLLNYNVVFELDQVSKDTANLFVETILAWLYQYRKNNELRGDELNHVLLLDEAKSVFSRYKEKQEASGMPVIDDMHSKIREFETGVIASDQEPRKLTETLLANTDVKVLLDTSTKRDFDLVADSMNLSELQRLWVRDFLETGRGLVQVGSGSPCPVVIRKNQYNGVIPDSSLYEQQQENWQRLYQEIPGTASSTGRKVETRVEQKELSKDEEMFLKDIAENPYLPASERYDKFSSKGKAGKVKKALEDDNWIQAIKIKKANGQIKLFKLSQKAQHYLDKNLGVVFEGSGRGSLRHQYWQHVIKEELRVLDEVVDVRVEYGNTDVHVETVDGVVAFEVGLSSVGRELDNLGKRLEGYDFVVHYSYNEVMRGELESEACSEFDCLDRVVFRTLPVERRGEDVLC